MDDNSEWLAALQREYRASMVAMTACAFAIDAFYGSTVERVPEARAPSKTRKARIVETLKLAYEIRGVQQGEVRSLILQVFTRRDEAVHPPAHFTEPAPHPTYGLALDRRYVWYRLENAETCRRGARQLLWFCLHKPRRKFPDLVDWCEGMKELMPNAAELRATIGPADPESA